MEIFEAIFTVNKIQTDVLGFIVYYTSVLCFKKQNTLNGS